MRVVNVVGYNFGFMYRDRLVVIPYDNREWIVPDDVDESQFGGNLKITVPRKPIVVSEVVKVDEVVSNTSSILINIDDVINKEPAPIITTIAPPVKKTVKRAKKASPSVTKQSF